MKTNINNVTHCANCGAPATTEICPYCHVATGLNSQQADMEYPVINCKESNINFWNVGFPMIFAVAFGFSGLSTSVIFSVINKFSGELGFFNFGFIFIIIGLIALIIAIIPIRRNVLLKKNGKEIEAVVYGYMNDNLFINNQPAQIVKLLVNTNDGNKFILYQLGDTKQPFKINSKIKLIVYKDVFQIVNKKQYYFE